MCKASNIRLAGFGGQGVMMVGQMIAYCASYDNIFGLWFPSYGPETRGGTANCSVIVSTKTINSPVFNKADCFMAFNLPSYMKYKDMVSEDGVILYNSSLITEVDNKTEVKAYGIPLNDIALGLGSIQVLNMVMLGAYLEWSGKFSQVTVDKVLEKYLGEKKAHLLEINKKAIQAGKEAMIAARG